MPATESTPETLSALEIIPSSDTLPEPPTVPDPSVNAHSMFAEKKSIFKLSLRTPGAPVQAPPKPPRQQQQHPAQEPRQLQQAQQLLHVIEERHTKIDIMQPEQNMPQLQMQQQQQQQQQQLQQQLQELKLPSRQGPALPARQSNRATGSYEPLDGSSGGGGAPSLASARNFHSSPVRSSSNAQLTSTSTLKPIVRNEEKASTASPSTSSSSYTVDPWQVSSKPNLAAALVPNTGVSSNLKVNDYNVFLLNLTPYREISLLLQ
jgi:hypothetical protein